MTCSKCNTDKTESCFPRRGGGRNGRHSYCKDCFSEYQKNWRRTPAGKSYRARLLATDAEKAKRKAYKKSAMGMAADRRYRSGDAGRATMARAKAALLTRRPNYNSEYSRARRASDPWFRLQFNLRRRQLHCFSGERSPGSFFKALGCARDEFVSRIERLFKPGMSWANYGEWQYDHDIPLAAFDLTNPRQFMDACHFTNIVPLWNAENKRKGAKLFDKTNDLLGGLRVEVTRRT